MAAAAGAVVLEDLHWADDATLDVVKCLGRRITALPALLIVTLRTGEIPRAIRSTRPPACSSRSRRQR